MKKIINDKKLNYILEEVNKLDIAKIKDVNIYKISFAYLLKSITFLFIISISIFISLKRLDLEKPLKANNIYLSVLILFLLAYVIYSLYYLLTYKIVIKNKKLIINKKEIELENITSINLVYSRVSSSKYDECLKIIADDNEYIIRLNIRNKYEFIKLVSYISKVNVGIE